ncbi:hypothetical protein CH253_17250 [Rhodococcus sp. 06-156-3C]|nr:hypothetical protein CH280_06575 [Rhodococcus sp. 06-156-4C]OZD18823.1 hypothetical protein CH253_17250 [Rhodococcus sp. 06-156-3C]OZD22333.1 hypothetical protein CH248_08835 [Rhodococcus sp. 06-156-4a]OZD34139.1 hypothetical protein CH247_08660 [Rhodococcus sp. 06-156-3b]OZD38876.1 hypothetical protein CH284_07080 [Rhodococcus sp. 06-156-3]OZF57336.1 hypothetical protein CH290_27865 [Rhodococcus sp. 06-156-4]
MSFSYGGALLPTASVDRTENILSQIRPFVHFPRLSARSYTHTRKATIGLDRSWRTFRSIIVRLYADINARIDGLTS